MFFYFPYGNQSLWPKKTQRQRICFLQTYCSILFKVFIVLETMSDGFQDSVVNVWVPLQQDVRYQPRNIYRWLLPEDSIFSISCRRVVNRDVLYGRGLFKIERFDIGAFRVYVLNSSVSVRRGEDSTLIHFQHRICLNGLELCQVRRLCFEIGAGCVR